MGSSSAVNPYLPATAPQNGSVAAFVRNTEKLEAQPQGDRQPWQQQNQHFSWQLQPSQQSPTHLQRSPYHLKSCGESYGFRLSHQKTRQGTPPNNCFSGQISSDDDISPQLQRSIRRPSSASAPRGCGDLVQPKRQRQSLISRCAAIVGEECQQGRYCLKISKRFSPDIPGPQQESAGGEAMCRFSDLPEAQRGRSNASVLPQSPSKKRPFKAGPSPFRDCHSTAMHSISLAAVVVTWQLLVCISSVGCYWPALEAGTFLSSAQSPAGSTSFASLFAVAEHAAAPTIYQSTPEYVSAQDEKPPCGRSRAQDAPVPPPSPLTWDFVPFCSPAVVAAAAGSFPLQFTASNSCAADGSAPLQDSVPMSKAVGAISAAMAAIKHVYTSLYPHLPSVLQLWDLRYPQSTFPHCLNFPTIEELSSDARDVRPALQRLKHKTFFRIFKFRLLAESCADTRLSELLNTRPDICTEPHRCGLCECSEDEIPSVWRRVPDEEFVDRRHAASFTRWTQHKSSRQPDDPFSIFKSPGRTKEDAESSLDGGVRDAVTISKNQIGSNNTQSRGIYVDLLLNPPMYTRYEGGDVWRFLYSQVPLPPAESAADALLPASTPPSPSPAKKSGTAGSGGISAVGAAPPPQGEISPAGGSGEEWPLMENAHLTDKQLCSSNANLRRVLSGMQANIAALAAENFFALHPPNGHFDPHAAFPLLPSSPVTVPSIPHSAPSEEAETQQQQQETSAAAGISTDLPSPSPVTEAVEEERASQTSVYAPSNFMASPTPPIFGRNLPFFRERLANQPLRVQNLYFVFGILLRAVCNLSDVLQECSCETGHRGEDLSARADLLHVLNVTTISTHACSPRYMNKPLFDPNQLAFLSSMESTDSLLRCIRCEKCRLHGKIKLGALYVAAKMLSSSESLPFLERNQVTALINALYYFADAIRVVEEMQEQINQHNIAAYVLFACLAVLLVLTAAFYLPRTGSRRDALLTRTWKTPTPSDVADVKKLQ